MFVTNATARATLPESAVILAETATAGVIAMVVFVAAQEREDATNATNVTGLVTLLATVRRNKIGVTTVTALAT